MANAIDIGMLDMLVTSTEGSEMANRMPLATARLIDEAAKARQVRTDFKNIAVIITSPGPVEVGPVIRPYHWQTATVDVPSDNVLVSLVIDTVIWTTVVVDGVPSWRQLA